MTHKRGNPNHDEIVHFMRENDRTLRLRANAVCDTGAWNIRFTYSKEETTCERCKEKLGIK